MADVARLVVKDNLTLVDHHQSLTLLADFMMLEGIRHQPLRRQLRVIPVLHLSPALFDKARIHREVTDQGPAPPHAVLDILGGVEALAAAGRPGIQCNAHSITLIQRRTI